MRVAKPLVATIVLLIAVVHLFRPEATLVQAFEVSLNPLGKSPLAALARVVTSRPTRVLRIEIEGGLASTYPQTPHAQEQDIVVLGLRPGHKQRVRLALSDQGNTELFTPWQTVETEPLPKDFPELKSVDNSGTSDTGYLLYFVTQWDKEHKLPFPTHGYLTITDCSGQVLWYQKHDTLLNEVRMDSRGNLVVQDMLGKQLYSQDLLGHKTFQYQASNLEPETKKGTQLATDTTHHDFVFDAAKGICWTLGSKRIGSRIDDLILGFDRNGKIQSEIPVSSLLPKERKAKPGKFAIWNLFYDGKFEDRSHANSIDIDASGRYAIVSLRHQDAVICVDLKTESLIWLLGAPGRSEDYYSKYRLKPKGQVPWPSRQHAAKWSSRGTLLMYDNGTKQSRVAEYRIDPVSMTVEQVWEFRDDSPFFSPILCDVDEVHQAKHLQITDGGRRDDSGRNWGRILEVSRDPNPKKLWELQVTTKVGKGVSIYRSERLQSLYGADGRKAEWAKE